MAPQCVPYLISEKGSNGFTAGAEEFGPRSNTVNFFFFLSWKMSKVISQSVNELLFSTLDKAPVAFILL